MPEDLVATASLAALPGAMLSDAPDRCPRCGGPFRCGVNDPGPCACTRVSLDAATLARLRSQYTGCLCLDCLAALAGNRAQAGQPDPR